MNALFQASYDLYKKQYPRMDTTRIFSNLKPKDNVVTMTLEHSTPFDDPNDFDPDLDSFPEAYDNLLSTGDYEGEYEFYKEDPYAFLDQVPSL